MAITKLVTGELERWDEFLQQALFTLRVRKHATTRHSPFYLLYGIEPRLPEDDKPPRPLVPLDEKELEEQHLQRNAQTFEELGHQRQAAYLRSKAQAVKMKDAHDNKHDSCSTNFYFAEGDWSHGQRIDHLVNQNNLAPWKENLNDNEDFQYYARGETSNEAVPYKPIAVGTNPVPAPKKAFQIKVPGRDDYMYQKVLRTKLKVGSYC
ncbi:hypothetical protein HDU92_008683 [Lobulomyces angularis]|nr:hypothetical protein HDU92_008683 [Lobulomyces angularis]